MLTHSCPISHNHVDEHMARVNATLTLTFLIFGSLITPFFWLLLFFDFLLRATRNCHLSPFSTFSHYLLRLSHIKPKPIDNAPKLFAARIGLFMNTLLIIFYLLHITLAWQITLAFFCIAASLEAFFAYCLGCQIYSLFPHKR